MEKKTYLFAGASSSIAQATAQLLKNQGHKIIGISTKENVQGFDDLYPITSYAFGNFPEIEEQIDGLVYFPGTIQLKPFPRLTAEDFSNDLAINFTGAAAFVQAYLSNLKRSASASIVFISSVAVSMAMPFHASIAASKGAVEGFAQSLAAEFAPKIRVNCVAPSLVDTPLSGKFLDSPEKIELMEKRNPMRKVGTPSEVAQAISFLLLPDSSWITGQVLAVDGGMNKIKNG